MLWQHDPSAASSAPDIFWDQAEGAGSGDSAPDLENWTALRTLRGHLQDVVGLAFSPCGQRLVSCSTDSTAIVFDVAKGAKLKILSDHKGWVNGVAWDPKNVLLASISSDRLLRVYKTKSFKLAQKTSKCALCLNGDSSEAKNVRLFHDDTFPSFFRRADFSPDGQLLAVPSGVMEVADGEIAATARHCTYLFAKADFSK